MLMTYKEILECLNGNLICGDLNKNFNGKIKLDSRFITPEDIFIAIKGTKDDGHNYINKALNLGASCIIISKELDIKTSSIVIMVDDTRKCLLDLALLIRKKYINIPVIAITGSVGKTTTKEILYNMLSKKYKVLKNIDNQNNNIGVPLTLFNLDSSYDICVLELGMNHEKEIDILSRICLPNDAIITNIGTSHIGNLGSKENIYKAKLEIINGMEKGSLIINGDDEYLIKTKSDILQLVKCGLKGNNAITATDILITENNLYFNIKFLDQYYPVIFPVPNVSLISNILLATAAAMKYQVSFENITSSLKDYVPLNGRNKIIHLRNNILLIDDSYNSSYESLNSGLKMIEQFSNNKIIVLGDILELGEFTDKIHSSITKILSQYEEIILVGSGMKNVVLSSKKHMYCKNVDDAIKYLETLNIDGRLIYIKGSHAMNLEKLVNYLKINFELKKAL